MQGGAGADAGGADTLGTGTSARGGSTAASGGTTAASGGTTAASGGTTAASGGTTAASGGTTAASGGTTAASGGTTAASGGSSAGTTKVDACLNVTCSTPPADTCVDATKTLTYSKTGSCLNGTCSYGSSAAVCKTGSTCTAGACTCTAGLADCGASCLDLKTSANNCGACGHSCLGGACNNGLCTPVVLASDQADTSALALDTGNVYWSMDSSIARVTKSGGTVESLAINQLKPKSIASDGSHVYWGGAAGSYVRRMPLTSTSYSDLVSATLPVTDMQLFGDWVYYVAYATDSAANSYVRRIPKTGGSPSDIVTSTGGAIELSVVGDCVFYLKFASRELAYKCPSGSITLAATGVSKGFDADNSGVYFGDSAGLKVMSMATFGISTLVPGIIASNVAVDATDAYYLKGSTGTSACGGDWQLWRVAKTGGIPVMLVDSPMACPMYLHVDNAAVYMYLDGDRSIVKVAK